MNHHRPVPQSFTLLVILALLISSALVARPVTAADTIMVTNLYDSGAGSLRQAIADIPSNGIITFDSSLSGQTITLNSTLVIENNMVIDAGALDQPVKLSGDQKVRVLQVFPNVTATLIFLVIRDGKLTVGGGADSGVGIRNEGTLTLQYCTVYFNETSWNGGGIYNQGFLTLYRSRIGRNSSDLYGGALFNDSYATLNVSESDIFENTAGLNGGGIYNNGIVIISNSTLSDNIADSVNNNSGYGGGIYNSSTGTVTITGSTISENIADGPEGYGGGILNGGIAIITNSTLSGNIAIGEDGYGGGIFNYTDLTIKNSTLFGNQVTSEGNGGGIYQSGTGTMTFVNSIIAGSDGGDCFNRGTIAPDSTHNLVMDGSCGGVPSSDIKLGPLADNGGSTLTHALLPGSPAIDAGSGAHCPDFDQRGVPRPQGAGCDIGAYELETLVVTSIADGGDGSLRKSIADISPGGTIIFDTDLSGQTIPLSSTLVIEKNLTIDGSDLAVPITISGNNAAGVFVISSLGKATFDSLMIINGASEYGGGIYNWANLTIINCTIANNYGKEGGGGIFNSGNAYLWIVDSTLSNNTTEGDGGGIFNMGFLEVVNSTLSGNEAGANGGGIHNEGILMVENSAISENRGLTGTGGGLHNEGTLTLLFVVLNGNEAGFGGGIYTNNTLIMTDSTLSGNSAYYGGGIYNPLGDSLINNSALFGNTATLDGGGILNEGTLYITNSTLSGNLAGLDGGGILNVGTLYITNSTLSGNLAGLNGGGILNDDMLTLLNVTLNGNSAVRHGGGIINFSGNTLNFINTIIAHSTNGGDCLNNGTIHADSTHNLVTDGSCGALLDDDPMLGPLANNGGPTLTHALLPGSPAIDAGHNDFCPMTDQRGVSRPQGTACDIGAFEFNLAIDGITFIFLPLIVK